MTHGSVETWVRSINSTPDMGEASRGWPGSLSIRARTLTAGRARFVECRGQGPEDTLAELLIEAQDLGDQADTTLLVMPSLNHSFDDFLDLVGMAEALLDAAGMARAVQLFHFHPRMSSRVWTPMTRQIARRAPHAVLHLLRWTDVRGGHGDHLCSRSPSETKPCSGHRSRRTAGPLGWCAAFGPASCTRAIQVLGSANQAIFDAHNDCWRTASSRTERRSSVSPSSSKRRGEELSGDRHLDGTARLSTPHVFDFDRVAAAPGLIRQDPGEEFISGGGC